MNSGWSQQVPASTAVPQVGRVSAGSASIQQGGTATNPVMTITQDTDRAVINWQSFNVGSNSTVQFQQPSSASVALNRVLGTDPSNIFGQISSNGQVYLVNPNGVYFSPSARVDVGGLVATTHGISDGEFMAGGSSFTRGQATGKVVNEGELKSHAGGYIALLAPEVRNAGVIIAKSGTIALASGDTVTLNVDANHSLTNLLVKPSTIQSLVDNQKIVQAPDGQVILSAQAYNEIAGGVINNSGEISAKGISKSGGQIVLGASTGITNSGKIDASTKTGNGGSVKLDAKRVTQSGAINADSSDTKGKGGRITLTGDLLTLKAGATLSANGPKGGGTILVGGDWQGSTDMRQAQSVTVEQGATLTANALDKGDGGKVVLWSNVADSNSLTQFDGSIEARGAGGGLGGRVETSGHVLGVAGSVVTGQGGQWLLDPADITIATTNSGATNTGGTFAPNTGVATVNISAASITAALGTGDVVVTTTNTGTAGAGTGTITLSNAITGSTGSLSLLATGTITLNAGITLSGAGKGLLVKTEKNIIIANGTTFQTNNGDMVFWSNSTALNSAYGIDIKTANTTGTNTFNTANGATTQTTGGGKLVFAGGLDDGANGGTANDNIPDGFAISTGSASPGVRIGLPVVTTSAVTMNTGGGDFIMRGQSSTDSGIAQYGGLNLKSGNGTITMTGVSTAKVGIDIASGSDNSLVNIISSAPTNAITMTGTANQSGGIGLAFGYSANVANAASSTVSSIALQSLGGGNITLTGRGGTGGTGVGLNDVSILANGGTITVDSGTSKIGFQTYTSVNSHPVTLGTCVACDATTISALGLYTGTSTANVVLKGDGAMFQTGTTSKIDTSGTVVILPSSADFTAAFDASQLTYSTSVASLTAGLSGSTFAQSYGKALTINGPITVYSGNLTMSGAVTATNDIIVNSMGTFLSSGVMTSSQGNITLTSTGVMQPNNTVTASNGAVTVTGQYLATKAITAKNDLTLTSTGTVSATGGISVGAFNLESTSAAVIINSQYDFSQTSANTLKAATNVSITSVKGYASPGIITAGNSITETTAGIAYGAGMTATAGSITVTGGTGVNMSGNQAAAGNIVNTATAGSLVHGASTISSTSGNITLTAGGTTAQGTYNNTGSITASAGTVTLTTAGTMGRGTLAGATVSGANGVTIQSTGSSVTFNSAIASSAGAVSIQGGTSVSMSTAASTVTASGNVTITAANGTASTAALTKSTSGNVSISSAGGTNGITTLGAINSAGTISITAPGTMTFTPSLISGGDITINSTGSSISFYGGTIAKTNGTNDATLNLYAATSVGLSTTVYAGSSTADTSVNGKLNVMINPGRISASAGPGSVSLTGQLGNTTAIRTQGGNITVVGGTDQSDFVLGGLQGAYGNSAITIGGSYTLSMITNGGNIKMFGKSSATGASNTNGAFYFQGGLTMNSGSGSILMNGVGQAGSFSGLYSYCNTCAGNNSITSTSGNINLIGSTINVSASGISFSTSSTSTMTISSTSGNITVAGYNSFNLPGTENATITSLPAYTNVTSTSGNVTIQGQVSLGYLGYTSPTYPGLSIGGNITAGGRILIQSDVGLQLGSNKLTSPDIDLVARTISGSLGANIFVPGSGRVLIYLSNVVGQNFVASNSNPTGTGTTFTHYGSTCSYSATAPCLENPSAVLPTTNGTILIGATLDSPVFPIDTKQDTPVVGAFSNSSIVYGAASFTKALSSTSTASVTYTSSNTAVATVNAAGLVTVTGAGSATITASQAATIYYKSASASYSVAVAQAPLTVTANGLTKTYDGNAFAGGNGVTYSGFVYGQTSSVLGGTLAYGGTAQGAKNAGSYTITPSGYTSTNYALSYVGAPLTINKADAILVANSDTYTYNGLARTASGFSAFGLVNGETVSVLSGVSVSGGGTNAGTYTVTPTGTSANYNLSFVNGTMTIDKAPATVTATSSSLTYDGQAHTNPGFTATGLVNGETVSVLSGVSVTGGGTNAGTYALTASGTDNNYRLTFVDGTMTINKAPLVVAAVADSKTYDGQAYTGGNGVTYSGLVNGESSAVLGGALAYSGTSQGATNAGSYAITPSGLTAANYAISYADAALTINKANLTVTAANANKTYDGQVYSGSNSVSYSGFVNGETDSVLSGTVAYGGSAKNAVNAGSYTIAPSGLSASNYAISYANGTLTIDKVNATVTVNSDNYIYNGQARTASGFVASGLVNGETESVLGGVVLTGGGTNAGTYAATASGTDTNYNLTFVPGTMTIAKAPLVITAVNDAKFITQTDATGYLGVTYSGLVNGETAQALTTAPTVTRSNAGVEAIGTYNGVLQASGATSSNYDISYVAGHYSIVPAGQLLVRVAPASLTYGGSESYTIASAQYLDNNNRAVSDLTSRTSVTGGSAVSMTDGYGGSASFTIGASGASYSSSGYLKAGGYNVGATSISTTSTHFSNQLTVVGSLQVDQAPVTASVTATSKTYDGSISAGTVGLAVTGALAGDVVTGTGLGLYDNKNVGSGKGMTATSLTLSGADGSNYYLASATATGSLGTITRKSVTVSGITALDKTYDGTRGASVDDTAAVLSGVVVGDTVSVSATGSFSDKNVGSAKTVTLTSQYGGTDSGNYVFTNQASTTASISAKSLSLSGITAANKVYDGTTSATVDGSLALATGLVAGDTISVAATGTFDDRNAGSGKTVTFVSSISGTDAGNYVIAAGQTTTTATVTPATLTVSGASAVNKTYDGTVAMPVGVTGYAAPIGVIGSDTVSVAGAAVYHAANAGAATVTQGSVALTGADAGNYSLNWVNGSGTIAKANATVTGNSSTLTYDGSLRLATGFSATGLVNGETDAVLTGVAAGGSGKTVGTYAVVPSGTADNYNLTFVNGTLTINKANLTVTANADTKTYSGLQYGGGNGVTYSGFVGSETSADLSGGLVYTGTSQGAVNAGTYTITPSGLLSGNYSISYQSADLTINKAPLHVTVNPDAKFITQADGAGYAGVSYSGFVNGETHAVLTATPTLLRTNAGTEGPGVYSGVLQASGAAAQNYTISYGAGDYTIVPAGQLLVRMTNASQVYGGSTTYAVASAQYLDLNGNGIVDLHSGASVAGTSVTINDGVGGVASFTVGPTAPSTSSSGRVSVGHYAVDASAINSTSANFSNTLTVLGNLDVSAAPVSAATTAVSKTYDGSVAAGSVTLALTGVLSGDTVAGAGTGVYADKNVGTSKTVTVSGLALSGADAGNYYLSSQTVSGATGAITPKALLVSGISAATKTYDRGVSATVSTSSANLDGLVAGDDVTVSATGTFATASAATGKTVTLASSYGGADVGNYTIFDQTTTLATIAQKTVTLTGSSGVTRAYDGTTGMSAGVTGYGALSGVLGIDVVSVTGSAAFAGPDAGAQAVKQGTAALSGADMGNYVLAWVDGSGTITKAALTVTASNASKTYDGLAYSGGNGVTYAGLVNSETSAVLGGTVSYSGSSRGAINAGSYAIKASGLTSSNYDISYVDGTLTVGKAALTVTADSPTYTYNGVARQASGFTAAGLVNGETISVLTGVSVSGGGTHAGSYTTTASGTSNNYDLTFVNGTMTINKAQATVTAASDNYVYNGLNRSASGFSATGLVNGETVAVLSGVSVSGGGANAGSYTTTLSGTDSNYTLTFVNGTMTVNKAPLTITALDAVKTYDGLAYSGGNHLNYVGLVNNETSAVLSGTASYAGTSQGAIGAGLYSLVPSGLGASNYAITYHNGSLAVWKADATVTAASDNLTYNGQSRTPSGFSVAGLVNGETLAVLTGVSVSGGGTNAGTYITTASGTDSNYSLTFVDGLMTINKAALTVTAANDNKTYNGLAYSGGNGVGYAGFVNNETSAVLSGSVSYGGTAQGAKNAGTYAITPSGLSSGNYDISYVDGALTVAKANATVTAGNDHYYYNGLSRSASGFKATGLVNGETTAVLTGVSVTGSGTNTGTYTVTGTGVDSNYNLTFLAGTMTILPKSLMMSGSTVTGRDYDGTRALVASAGSLSGLIGSETLSVTVTATSASKDAGTQTATLAYGLADGSNGGMASNYTLADTVLPITITPKALTVTGSSVTDRIYDGTRAIASSAGTLSGLIGSENILVTSTATASSKNAGPQTATLAYSLSNGSNGGIASNYSLADGNMPVLIAQKDLTVTGTKAATKTFDGKTDAAVSGGSLVGVLAGDQVSLIEAGAFASSNAGNAVSVVMNDQIAGADVANYRLIQPLGVTGTINANTPILYPSPSSASPMSSQRPSAAASTTGTGTASGWVVEDNTGAGAAGQPADASRGGVQAPGGTGNSSVVIKANSDSGSIQNVPDYLNVGRAVLFDGPQSSPVIVGATISFDKGFEAGKTLLELNAVPGISAQIDNSNGKIILTGSASVSDYNRVVQTLRMKLNGGDNRRVVAMNLSLVDQGGSRKTRLITLKPMDAGSQAEIIMPIPAMAAPQATTPGRFERLGAVTLPGLPSAQIQYP